MLSEDSGGPTKKGSLWLCGDIKRWNTQFYGDYFMATSMLLPTTISWRTNLLHCSEEMVDTVGETDTRSNSCLMGHSIVLRSHVNFHMGPTWFYFMAYVTFGLKHTQCFNQDWFHWRTGIWQCQDAGMFHERSDRDSDSLYKSNQPGAPFFLSSHLGKVDSGTSHSFPPQQWVSFCCRY